MVPSVRRSEEHIVERGVVPLQLPYTSRWRRAAAACGRRRVAVLASVGIVTVVGASAVAPTVALARTASVHARAHRSGATAIREVVAQSPADDGLPPDCVPAPAGPPTSPYELGLVGTVTNGALTTGSWTVSNIDAKFCGIVTVVNGTPPCLVTGDIEVPPDGQMFGPLSVALTPVPGMSPVVGLVANPGPISGTLSCGSSQNGLAVALDAVVGGSTAPLFGVSCTIGPVTIPLGGSVTGPLGSATATLTGNDFGVPAIQPSPTCPSAVASNIDAIAGLPLAAGGASATLPATASLYQPGP
jgi:hypothetical protein